MRLMTAATYGLPVVATEVPGIRGYGELVCSMVPPADAHAMRDAVNRYVTSPELLRRDALQVRKAASLRPRSLYIEELRTMFHS